MGPERYTRQRPFAVDQTDQSLKGLHGQPGDNVQKPAMQKGRFSSAGERPAKAHPYGTTRILDHKLNAAPVSGIKFVPILYAMRISVVMVIRSDAGTAASEG